MLIVSDYDWWGMISLDRRVAGYEEGVVGWYQTRILLTKKREKI